MDIQSESCKVVLLGESGVGKTSIISQFMEQEFSDEQTATTGATFSTKSLQFEKYNKEVSFEIWDTAGQEKYRALTKMFYKDAAVAILVYDITRLDSFEELKSYWANQIKENAPKKIIIALAANKSDLYESEKVEESAGREFAKEIGAMFKLTSAKNMSGIEELFKDIGNKFLDPNAEFSEEAKAEDMEAKERRKKTIKVKKEEPTESHPEIAENEGAAQKEIPQSAKDKKNKRGCC